MPARRPYGPPVECLERRVHPGPGRGEVPVDPVQYGDEVFAGTLNGWGTLRVKAEHDPSESVTANADSHGVLAKSAVVMERLGRIDAVALDSIEALIEGTPCLTDLLPLDASGLEENEFLRFTAAAEHSSERSLPRAVVDVARTRRLALTAAESLSSLLEPGSHRHGWQPRPPTLRPRSPGRRTGTGRAYDTAVVVVLDGYPVGLLGIADRPRPGPGHRWPPRAAAGLAVEVGITDA